MTLEKPYSIDRNMLHVSYEGGVLEDPWRAPDEDDVPDHLLRRKTPRTLAVELVIGFERGQADFGRRTDRASPVGLLLAQLNRVAGEHGVGRVDMVENRFVGLKSRGVYETPGGTVLAHRASGHGVDHHGPRGDARARPVDAALRGVDLQRLLVFAGNGLRSAPPSMPHRSNVTGEVRVKLYKGGVCVTGRRSPVSLYSEALSSFEDAGEADTYDQRDAEPVSSASRDCVSDEGLTPFAAISGSGVARNFEDVGDARASSRQRRAR